MTAGRQLNGDTGQVFFTISRGEVEKSAVRPDSIESKAQIQVWYLSMSPFKTY